MMILTLRRNSHIGRRHRFNFYEHDIKALADPANEIHDKEEAVAFRARLESTVGRARFADDVRRSRHGIFVDTTAVRGRTAPGSNTRTV